MGSMIRNFRRLNWAAGREAQMQPGAMCIFCKQPATYMAYGLRYCRPLCAGHAAQAKRLGYPVEPPLQEVPDA